MPRYFVEIDGFIESGKSLEDVEEDFKDKCKSLKLDSLDVRVFLSPKRAEK